MKEAFWIRVCTIASAIALVIMISALGISLSTQTLRQQATDRQQQINQAISLSQLNTRLANSLAVIANRDNDEKIRKLLADLGITIKADQPVPASAPPK